MTFVFGAGSRARLETVRPELRETAELALSWQIYDFTIVWGWRSEEQQEQAFRSGASKKRWPDSNHNTMTDDGMPCSDALDFAPWVWLPGGGMGIPWHDTHAFAMVGGLILAAGAQLGYRLRYGGDWDGDGNTTDQLLMDWGHVEILNNGVSV